LHENVLLGLLRDRPVAYRPDLARAVGSATAGIFLSQALFLDGIIQRMHPDRNGWFYKTAQEWEADTGLSRTEQSTARRRLVSLGVIQEECRGVPAKMWFRVRFDVLIPFLETYYSSGGSSPPDAKKHRDKTTDDSSFQDSSKLSYSQDAPNNAGANSSFQDSLNQGFRNPENKVGEHHSSFQDSLKQGFRNPENKVGEHHSSFQDSLKQGFRNPENKVSGTLKTTTETTTETTKNVVVVGAPHELANMSNHPGEPLPLHGKEEPAPIGRDGDVPSDSGCDIPGNGDVRRLSVKMAANEDTPPSPSVVWSPEAVRERMEHVVEPAALVSVGEIVATVAGGLFPRGRVPEVTIDKACPQEPQKNGHDAGDRTVRLLDRPVEQPGEGVAPAGRFPGPSQPKEVNPGEEAVVADIRAAIMAATGADVPPVYVYALLSEYPSAAIMDKIRLMVDMGRQKLRNVPGLLRFLLAKDCQHISGQAREDEPQAANSARERYGGASDRTPFKRNGGRRESARAKQAEEREREERRRELLTTIFVS